MKDYTRMIQDVNNFILKAEADEHLTGEAQKAVDRNFEITHRKMLVEYIRSKANNEVKAHILSNARLDSGVYLGTMEETSAATHITKKTVNDAFKVLQEHDFIRLYNSGMWVINPKLLRKGTGGKYIGQIKFYYSLPMNRKKGESKNG